PEVVAQRSRTAARHARKNYKPPSTGDDRYAVVQCEAADECVRAARVARVPELHLQRTDGRDHTNAADEGVFSRRLLWMQSACDRSAHRSGKGTKRSRCCGGVEVLRSRSRLLHL